MHKRVVGEIATDTPSSNPHKMFISAVKIALWKGMDCVQFSLLPMNLFFLNSKDFPTLGTPLYTKEFWNLDLRFSILKT